jgi:hypothetical protein
MSEQEYEYILMKETKNVIQMCVLVHPILTQAQSSQISCTHVLNKV